MPNSFQKERIWDHVIGWRGASPATRVRLMEAFCANIRLKTVVSNIATLLILMAFLVPQFDSVSHVAWLCLVVLGGLLPRTYAIYLRRTGNFRQNPERAALAFIAISGLYGLAWGAGPLLLLPTLSGLADGILLFIVTFGTIMGPYATMPGVLYVRLLTTGLPTLVAVGLYMEPTVGLVASVSAVWLLLRTDIWRSYHNSLRRQIDLQIGLEAKKAVLERTNQEKDEANETLKILAETDPLTGVANRRQFMRRLRTLQGPAAVVLMDLDHFKTINDTYGHDAGDAVLVDTARLVQDVLRRDDLLARIGGEEFALILVNSDAANAWAVAERIRERIGRHVMMSREQPVRVTASLGVALVHAGRPADDAVLREADAELYEAKRRGRNRTCLGTCEQTA